MSKSIPTPTSFYILVYSTSLIPINALPAERLRPPQAHWLEVIAADMANYSESELYIVRM